MKNIGTGLDENIAKFVMNFQDIIHEVLEMEKHTMHFGTDTELTRSEVHLIKAIKENPDAHVTKLAEILDITKGAVSQMLIKLNKKKMIIKETDPENKSRLLIKLTQKGEVAYVNHEEFHENSNSVFISLFDGYTEKELKLFGDFAENSKKKLQKLNSEVRNRNK